MWCVLQPEESDQGMRGPGIDVASLVRYLQWWGLPLLLATWLGQGPKDSTASETGIVICSTVESYAELIGDAHVPNKANNAYPKATSGQENSMEESLTIVSPCTTIIF